MTSAFTLYKDNFCFKPQKLDAGGDKPALTLTILNYMWSQIVSVATGELINFFIEDFVFLSSGRLLTCGNIAYVLLFGWWVSLIYLLVGTLMFITIAGVSYGESLK